MAVTLSVCIVGHGPSLQKAGQGEYIDSHDVVVRMAYCAWQDARDYGTQYTYGALTVRKVHRVTDREPRPERGYWCYTKVTAPGIEVPKSLNGVSVESIDPEPWHEVMRSLGAKSGNENPSGFSLGALAALTANQRFRPTEMSLVGMDWSLNGASGQQHPQGYPWMKGKKPSANDWSVEGVALKEIIGE